MVLLMDFATLTVDSLVKIDAAVYGLDISFGVNELPG